MKEYILLIPNNIKTEIIKLAREKNYNYNIKFMSLEEFIKNYTFDYNEKTIYFLMKEYNINYDTASIYLENLYYIDNALSNKKMKKLKEIKEYLDRNSLLIYNKTFKNYIKDKEIYIYGYNYISKYSQKILKSLNYKEVKKELKNYQIKEIYYSNYIEDEVIFVANKIAELIKNNINIENIKIIANNEYNEIIKRIFKLYNIKMSNQKSNIYSTYECKKMLNNLNNIEDELEKLTDVNIKNKIINILNKYSFIDNKSLAKELIVKDLKNTYLESNNKGIKNITLKDYISDNDYVFLMGFNKENIPKIYKDNEYFSDKERKILNLDTSHELNMEERKNIVKKLHSIKNITITYKLYDSNSNYTKADLLEDIPEIPITNNDYSHSHIMNKIFLTEKLDSLTKYNIKENDLNLLFSNYQIPYMEYDNSYKGIEKDLLYKYLNDRLVLSYTSFDNYNKCKFKYYLNHILKINIIKDDFAIIIGNICHYVLSNIDNEDFDTYKYFDNYLINEREFSEREKFFISIIREEMPFIVETIKKQLTYTTFDKKMYEEKVYVNLDKNIKVTFMGVIDKVLYKEEEGKTLLAVIDYKTGSTDIKLENKEYGIGLQLPIYLYLSSKMKIKNVKIVGFFLQKLLSNNLDNTKDYITAKENTLKLEGYSIDNESILSKFDTTYNNSKLIKSMKTSNNGFYSYSKVLKEEEIEDLIKETESLIDNSINQILEANFKIDPKIINGENISCSFCEYKDICYRKEKDIIYINKREENNE